MADCCSDKEEARKHGMFEGPVGDGWYECQCKKDAKMHINKDTPDNMVFVFGSNTGGIHGAGAAQFAYKKKGARWGFSYGHMGDSFAIPTKGHKHYPASAKHAAGIGVGDTLPLTQIEDYVRGFLAYARTHPELTFQVTCIGCGLAGLHHENIAPMFEHAPSNCYFDKKWEHLMPIGTPIWGEG